MLSGVQRISGRCSRTAAASSEKFDGRPKPARSACQVAGVPSAIKRFSITPQSSSVRLFVRSIFDADCKVLRADPRPCSRPLSDLVVDVTPTLDGFDVAIHGGEVLAHRYDRDVTPPGFAPCRNVAGPLIVAATVLLDGLKTE